MRIVRADGGLSTLVRLAMLNLQMVLFSIINRDHPPRRGKREIRVEAELANWMYQELTAYRKLENIAYTNSTTAHPTVTYQFEGHK